MKSKLRKDVIPPKRIPIRFRNMPIHQSEQLSEHSLLIRHPTAVLKTNEIERDVA